MRGNIVCLFLMVVLMEGCAGQFDYVKPTALYKNNNYKEMNKNKDEVWKQIVPSLGKAFFVINNLDKDSGLVNISYSGDPERYIDCGFIDSYVKNARGERRYKFPAAKAFQKYEIMNQNGLFFINRKMNLEGRMNLIVEEISPINTRITANTKYLVTKTFNVRGVQGRSNTETDTISFNTGTTGTFPSGTLCYPNGQFEEEVLSLLTGQ